MRGGESAATGRAEMEPSVRSTRGVARRGRPTSEPFDIGTTQAASKRDLNSGFGQNFFPSGVKVIRGGKGE